MIDGVVAPLPHNKDPPKDDAVNSELPQLFTTVISGAGIKLTVNVAGLELTGPPLFVHIARYCLLLSEVVAANVNTALTAPLIFVQVVPSRLDCHCTVGPPPVAADVKLTLLPAHTFCDDGFVVIVGGILAADTFPLISNREVLDCCVDGKLIPSV